MTIFERRPDQVQAHYWHGILRDLDDIIQATRPSEFHAHHIPEIEEGQHQGRYTWTLHLTVRGAKLTLDVGDVIYREPLGDWKITTQDEFNKAWKATN